MTRHVVSAELANCDFIVNNANVVNITGNPKYFHTCGFSEREGGLCSVDGSPSAVAIVVRVAYPFSGIRPCMRCVCVRCEWASESEGTAYVHTVNDCEKKEKQKE